MINSESSEAGNVFASMRVTETNPASSTRLVDGIERDEVSGHQSYGEKAIESTSHKAKKSRFTSSWGSVSVYCTTRQWMALRVRSSNSTVHCAKNTCSPEVSAVILTGSETLTPWL